MPVVEVPCPNCGARFKAPDSMAGKKAKCGKCNGVFRIPVAPVGESVDNANVPMAAPVDEAPSLSPPPAQPAPALESVDPFDFSTSAAKPAPAPTVKPVPVPAAKPAPKPAPAPAAPAVPVDEGPSLSPPPPAPPAPALESVDPFDFSTSAAKPAPAPAAKPAPKPASAPAAPAVVGVKAESAPKVAPKPAAPALPSKPAAAAPTAPAAPAAKPAPKPAAPSPPPAAPAEPAVPEAAAPVGPEAADPFAFTDAPAKPAKSKNRDEGDQPAKGATRRDDGENAPPAKPKRRGEDDEKVEAPRKKGKRSDDEGEPPAKSKDKAKAAEDEPYNPFADYPSDPEPEPDKKSKKGRDEDNDPKAQKKGEGDEDEPEKPRYRRPEEVGRGLMKSVLITAVIGGIAAVLGVAAAAMYIKNNRQPPPEPEAKKEEKADPNALPDFKIDPPKKDPPKEEPPKVAPPKVEPPKVEPPKTDPKVDPKAEPKTNPKVDPPKKDAPKTEPPKKDAPKTEPPKKDAPKKDAPKTEPPKKDAPKAPGAARAPLTLPGNVLPINVGALPGKLAPADRPNRDAGGSKTIEAALASVRRVFPPLKPATSDALVLVQTSPALGGKGEKLALDAYGPAGNRVPNARIEYGGDGSAAPIADVHAPTGEHFLAVTGGKLHVWSVSDRAKKVDGADPYADKPEHAKAGPAAAFFAADPNLVVVVSTAGAVHLYDLRSRKTVSEFVPPHTGPGRVALGRSVAKSDENGSVVVAVGGVIHQLRAATGLPVLRKHDLGGDVGRSLALAASGAPGRLLYAFETAPDKGAKKERALFGLPLGDKARPVLYRLPDPLGEPKAAVFANEAFGGVVVDRGLLWFDDHDGKFLPLVLTQPPGPGQYYGDERCFWYVVPQPAMAAKSVLVPLSAPFGGFVEGNPNFAKKPIPAVRIDDTGLLK